MYIAGQWRDGSNGAKFDAINPFTGRAWATVAQAEVGDVNSAIAAARETFERTWSRVNGYERGRLMLKLAELLQNDAERMGRLESTDNGKIIRETQVQMGLAARQYRFFAGYADKLWGQQIPLDQRDVLDYTVREPLGVVALITAWNSPMGLLANKLAPSLASGNCVVIKPSEHASVTTLEFCKFIDAAGFPPGAVNVVCGPAEVGRALVEGGVAKVSFTGSPSVGREIAAAAGRKLVPVTLELGGKSPNIIFDDANLENAAVGALAGIFGATGQTCVAGSRLLVQRGVHDYIVETLAGRAKTVRLGDPLDPATDMGTAANEPQFRRILGCIDRRQLFDLSQAKSYMQTMLVASGTKQLLLQDKSTSLRGLFYMLKHTIQGTKENTFEDQSECDPVVEDIEVLLNTLREELHLYASNRGTIVGPITLVDSGDTIDCSRMGSGGYSIPSIVEPEVMQFIKCDAKFILHVEKDTVWHRSTKQVLEKAQLSSDAWDGPATARRETVAQSPSLRIEATHLLSPR